MREISLSHGKVARVDDADYPSVAEHRWYALQGHSTWYAWRPSRKANGQQRTIYLHRFIMGAGSQQEVDHLNGNGLDNQRHNLRLCTHAQNQMAARRRARAASGYRGVRRTRYPGKSWCAEIKLNQRTRYLGAFATREEAARAYNTAALRLFGEFAVPNEVPA